MKLLCKKHNGVIVPANDEAAEVFARIYNGAVITCIIEQPRNPSFLAKYWASVDMIVENQEKYRDKYELHDAIKSRLGVESVAIDQMDEVDFTDFFERYCDLIETELMPEASKETFWEEVAERL